MSKTMTREQVRDYFLEYFRGRRVPEPGTQALKEIVAESRKALRMLEPDVVVSAQVAAMGFADAMSLLEPDVPADAKWVN